MYSGFETSSELETDLYDLTGEDKTALRDDPVKLTVGDSVDVGLQIRAFGADVGEFEEILTIVADRPDESSDNPLSGFPLAAFRGAVLGRFDSANGTPPERNCYETKQTAPVRRVARGHGRGDARTGVSTDVNADRTVTIGIADDSSALLLLDPTLNGSTNDALSS